MRTSARAARGWRPLALGVVLALVTTSAVAASTPTTIAPGRLPQTSTRPPVASGDLTSRLTPLWRALVRGDAASALTSFFPRDAYLRMKTGLLADPSADYAQRLVALFRLDVAAYHRVLLTGGAPTLVRVSAASADAAWIAPHGCENLIGYWHLPGVRLVYRHGARVSSVAIASLISWRGVWYVVHLGPNPRPRDVGTVDGFAEGPGRPGPAGGC
jgi:hypothetical protein